MRSFFLFSPAFNHPVTQSEIRTREFCNAITGFIVFFTILRVNCFDCLGFFMSNAKSTMSQREREKERERNRVSVVVVVV